jgi:4-amino-4-deoxy-L-arabinose transferase-like glycosyltransferase
VSGAQVSASSRGATQAAIVLSIAALIAVLSVRVIGPNDLWDQTQPKTVSYTTDILVNGNWMLPIERGALPATKPPLYNWIAAPAVAVLGFGSTLAHKMPSVLSLIVAWIVMVRSGRWIDEREGLLVGALAGLMFVVNYTMFKLGYLARPDMLLTLFLVIAWLSATWIYTIDEAEAAGRRGSRLALLFWICVGLAGLAKGPPALGVVLYAVVAARWVGGSWSMLRRLRWWWCLPLGFGPLVAWLAVVGWADPDHLRALWHDEVLGRVTGEGPEGGREGPMAIIKQLPSMTLYFLSRFVPWSILTVIGMVVLWSRVEKNGPRRWRTLGTTGQRLHGGALFIVLTVGIYSLSAGKRADYIAAAFGPASLIAAWWLISVSHPRAWAPWLAGIGSAVLLVAIPRFNYFALERPEAALGDGIMAFAHDAADRVRADPAPMVFVETGTSQLQAIVGASTAEGQETFRRQLEAGVPFWAFVGTGSRTPRRATRRLVRQCDGWRLEERHASQRFDDTVYAGWPRQVLLLRVEPE